jgi:hypothetical protein
MDTDDGEAGMEDARAAFEADMVQRFGTNAKVVYEGDSAADQLQFAGWCGMRNTTTSTGTQYGGWVDGNGPDTYTAAALCKNGGTANGTTRWCGDRRGSVATCGSGIAGLRSFVIVDN